MNKHFKSLLLPISISIVTYLVFFWQLFLPNYNIWGSDFATKHLPAREYLYNTIVKEHRFPFWTEKMYLGFPIYADSENAYLNPVNVLSILIFGPVLSYKILLVGSYLIGSLSLYLLLKRKGFGLIAFSLCNCIYYFNYFELNHLIHLNIILTTYLLPLNILLIDKFFGSRKSSLITAHALLLAYEFYWGHIQTVALIFLGILVYSFIHTLNWKVLLSYIAKLSALVLILVLPLIVAAYPELKASDRSTEDSTAFFKQGSFTPQMLTAVVYPFIFGRYDTFDGRKEIKEYTYTETYVYLGISVFLLTLFGLAAGELTKLKVFATILIYISVVLTLVRFLPALGMFPIINIFRYWPRSMLLGSLGFGLLAAEALKIEKIKVNYKGLALIVLPVIFLIGLAYITKESYFTKVMTQIMATSWLTYGYDLKVWKVIIIVSGFAIGLLAFSKWKKYKKVSVCVSVILVFIVLFDLRYYGSDVLQLRVSKKENYIHENVDIYAPARRLILDKRNIQGLQFLLYDFWSPYGYSMYVSAEYIKYFKLLSIGNIKFPQLFKNTEVNSELVQNSGFYALETDLNKFNILSTKKIDLIQNEIDGEYLKKTEGAIIMSLDNPTTQNIKTFITYHRDWEVYIDGKKLIPATWNGLFINFPLDKGVHVIEFMFVPKGLYYAYVVSIGVIVLLVVWHLVYLKKLRTYSSKQD